MNASPMHIVLGLLGAIVTILILVKRLSDADFRLNDLNPFLLHRRKKWQSEYSGNPIFNIQDPMEASALILTAAAKIDGVISSEQKSFLLKVFREKFHLSDVSASSLLTSSNYILGDGQAIKASLDKVMKPSLEKYSESQSKSTILMLQELCDLDQHENKQRQEFSTSCEALLMRPFIEKESWT